MKVSKINNDITNYENKIKNLNKTINFVTQQNHGLKEPLFLKNIKKKIKHNINNPNKIQKTVLNTIGLADESFANLTNQKFSILDNQQVKEVVKDEFLEREKYYTDIEVYKENEINKNININKPLLEGFKNNNDYMKEKNKIYELIKRKIPNDHKIYENIHQLTSISGFDYWGLLNFVFKFNPHNENIDDFLTLKFKTFEEGNNQLYRLLNSIEIKYDIIYYLINKNEWNAYDIILKNIALFDYSSIKVFLTKTNTPNKTSENKSQIDSNSINKGIINYCENSNDENLKTLADKLKKETNEEEKKKIESQILELMLSVGFENKNKNDILAELKNSIKLPDNFTSDKNLVDQINKKLITDIDIDFNKTNLLNNAVMSSVKIMDTKIITEDKKEMTAAQYWIKDILEDNEWELWGLTITDSIMGFFPKIISFSPGETAAQAAFAGVTLLGGLFETKTEDNPFLKEAAAEKERYRQKESLKAYSIKNLFLKSIVKFTKLLWKLTVTAFTLIPKLISFLYYKMMPNLEYYIEKGLNKIISSEWNKTFAWFLAGVLAASVFILVIGITLILSVSTVTNIITWCFHNAISNTVSLSISSAFLAVMGFEEKVFGKARVSGFMYDSFNYMKGYSHEKYTGYKSEYDQRCKDINSDFYKNNAFCQENKEHDIKLYEKELKDDEILVLDENFLGKKKLRTESIPDPRGETFPGIGGYCNENCQTGKDYIKQFYEKYIKNIVNNSTIVETDEKKINLILDKYKDDTKSIAIGGVNIITYLWETIKHLFGFTEKIDLSDNDIENRIIKGFTKDNVLRILYNIDNDILGFGNYQFDMVKKVQYDVLLRLANFFSMIYKKYPAEIKKFDQLKADSNKIDQLSQTNDHIFEKFNLFNTYLITDIFELDKNKKLYNYMTKELPNNIFSNNFSLNESNNTIEDNLSRKSIKTYYENKEKGLNNYFVDLIHQIYNSMKADKLNIERKIKNLGDNVRTLSIQADIEIYKFLIEYWRNIYQLFIHITTVLLLDESGECMEVKKRKQGTFLQQTYQFFAGDQKCIVKNVDEINSIIKKLNELCTFFGTNTKDKNVSLSSIYELKYITTSQGFDYDSFNKAVLDSMKYLLIPKDNYTFEFKEYLDMMFILGFKFQSEIIYNSNPKIIETSNHEIQKFIEYVKKLKLNWHY